MMRRCTARLAVLMVLLGSSFACSTGATSGGQDQTSEDGRNQQDFQADQGIPETLDVPNVELMGEVAEYVPQKGEFGWPCAANEECDSFFCVDTADGGKCTKECLEGPRSSFRPANIHGGLGHGSGSLIPPPTPEVGCRRAADCCRFDGRASRYTTWADFSREFGQASPAGCVAEGLSLRCGAPLGLGAQAAVRLVAAGLRGTASLSSSTSNRLRGFWAKNRSAAVVPSGRVMK